MIEDNVKERLIQATMDLLDESKSSKKITARKIADAAEANLAMINYYFKSKDELVMIAVSRLIEASAQRQKRIQDENRSPKERLIDFLIATSDTTCEFSDLTRPTIPYLLLEGDFDLSYELLPYVKACLPNQTAESESRLIAFQLVSCLQLTFYRSEDFSRFASIDVMDQTQRHQLCRIIVEQLISN